MRRISRMMLVLALAAVVAAKAVGAEGNLCLLGIGINQQGDQGSWQPVGPTGGWKNTLAGVFFRDRLYTVETNGILWRTDIDTGTWQQVGQPDFGNTAFMYCDAAWLYTIEKDGSLYRVSAADGTWKQVGAAGDWKDTLAGAILNGRLYTIEASGALYATDLATGKWKQIGKAEFADTKYLFAAGTSLYAIERNGDLSWINPGDGSWKRLGAAGAWKDVRGGAVVSGLLYTAGGDGVLWETNLTSAARNKIGAADFAATTAMFAAGNVGLTIETDGSLYRVNVKPTTAIDDYDWCSQEIEKAFREQGRPFYRAMNVRQILGRQATRANMLGGLSWLRGIVTKNDLAIVYIDSHGMTEPKKGWSIMTADGKQLWGREIKAQFGQLPCPVIVMIETCTSGGFARPHPDDLPVPPNVTVLCACQEDQSANNELDLAVGEALFGRADFNHDGVVDLDELIRYVPSRYREMWPKPESGNSPVIVKSAGLPGSRHLTRVSPALAAVVDHGELYSALVEGAAGNRYRVHLLGWSSSPGPYFRANTEVRDNLCLPSDGPPLLVIQNGQWYGARLVGKVGGKFKVHYLGYNEEEVVTKERIKYPFVGLGPGKN